MSHRQRDNAPVKHATEHADRTRSQMSRDVPSQSTREQHRSVSATPPLPSPSLRQTISGSIQSVELPPLQHPPKPSPLSISPAAVPSILNPAPEEDLTHSRRRKACELEDPVIFHPTLPSSLGESPSSQASAGSRLSSQSPRLSASPTGDSHTRRFLTPKSPSLHHASSVVQLGRPTGTISAKAVPFITESNFATPKSPAVHRPHNPTQLGHPPVMVKSEPLTLVSQPSVHSKTEHNNHQAQLPPSSSSQIRVNHYVPLPPSTPLGITQSSANPQQPNRSPTDAGIRTTYPIYSQRTDINPVLQCSPRFAPEAGGLHDPPGIVLSGPHRQLPMNVPISSSGSQGIYQYMKMNMRDGNIDVPIDIQAASRVADEKRRRNAGASARFRARRKEKEKESSDAIAKLQQQVKELSEDVDHYKHERDYLAGVVMQVQGGEQHFKRLSSPRRERSLSAMSDTGSKGAYSQDPEESPGDDHRAEDMQAAHLSTFPSHILNHNGQQSLQTTSPRGPPSFAVQVPNGVTTPSLGSLHSSTPAPSVLPPPLSRDLLTLQNPIGSGIQPPQLMQATPQTGPSNPYAAERRHAAPLG